MVGKQRTFSGTIWDTPEELERGKELNGKQAHAELSNGNGIDKQPAANSQDHNTEMSTAM